MPRKKKEEILENGDSPAPAPRRRGRPKKEQNPEKTPLESNGAEPVQQENESNRPVDKSKPQEEDALVPVAPKKYTKPWVKAKESEDSNGKQEGETVADESQNNTKNSQDQALVSSASHTPLVPAHDKSLASSVSDTPLVPIQPKKRPLAQEEAESSPTKRPKLNPPLPKKTKPITSATPSISSSTISLSQYKDLESRYQKLKDLKETRAEQALRDYKQASEKRFKAQNELFKQLNEKYNQEIKKNEQAPAPSPAVARNSYGNDVDYLKESIDVLTANLESATDEITVLKARLQASNSSSAQSNKDSAVQSLVISSELSGLVIKGVVEKEGTLTFDCIQSGRNGVFHYTLSLPKKQSDGDEVTFIPLIDQKDEHLLSVLPDYFAEPLAFQRSAVSIYMQKAPPFVFFLLFFFTLLHY